MVNEFEHKKKWTFQVLQRPVEHFLIAEFSFTPNIYSLQRRLQKSRIVKIFPYFLLTT